VEVRPALSMNAPGEPYPYPQVDELIYGETLDPNPHPINEIPLMRPDAFMESAGEDRVRVRARG